jgi:hypothetical protein
LTDLLAEQPQEGQEVETDESGESEEEETLEEAAIRKFESVRTEETSSTEAAPAEWAVNETTFANPQAAAANASQMVESGQNQD